MVELAARGSDAKCGGYNGLAGGRDSRFASSGSRGVVVIAVVALVAVDLGQGETLVSLGVAEDGGDLALDRLEGLGGSVDERGALGVNFFEVVGLLLLLGGEVMEADEGSVEPFGERAAQGVVEEAGHLVAGSAGELGVEVLAEDEFAGDVGEGLEDGVGDDEHAVLKEEKAVAAARHGGGDEDGEAGAVLAGVGFELLDPSGAELGGEFDLPDDATGVLTVGSADVLNEVGTVGTGGDGLDLVVAEDRREVRLHVDLAGLALGLLRALLELAVKFVVHGPGLREFALGVGEGAATALLLLLHGVGTDLGAFCVEAAVGVEFGLGAGQFGGGELFAEVDFGGAEGGKLRLAGFFLLGGVAAEGVEFGFGLSFGVGEGLGDGGFELLAGGVTLSLGAGKIEFRGGAGLGEGAGVGLGGGGGRDFEFAALLGGDAVAEVFFLCGLVEFEALQHGGVEAVAQDEGVPAGRTVDGLGERETEVGGAHGMR